MAKKDAKSGKKSGAFSDSAEIFEDIFKEATQSFEKPKQASRTSTDRGGAAPQKRTPQMERKPAGSVQTPSRSGERGTGVPTQTIIKSQTEYKPRKPTSILKIGILLVLFLILGGALLNYFGFVDISAVLDLFGIAKKEVVQAPRPKRVPAKTPGKAGSAPAKKQGGEKVASAVPKKAEPPAPVEAKQQPAKVETSAPIVQTQPQQKVAREEPPPPAQPVQPKAETPAPTPSGQGAAQVTQKEATGPPARAEPKQMPAPVTPRAPAVALATQGVRPPVVKPRPLVKPAATEVGPSQIGSLGYAYSIYLGSYQTPERAKKAISMYQQEGLAIYWSKVNLREKGTWYRVFAGYFRSEAEASDFIARKGLKDAEVKMTKYSVLIGVYSSREEAQQKSAALLALGFPAYVIPEAQARFRLYSGAFNTKDGAEINVAELASKGVQSRAVER